MDNYQQEAVLYFISAVLSLLFVRRFVQENKGRELEEMEGLVKKAANL